MRTTKRRCRQKSFSSVLVEGKSRGHRRCTYRKQVSSLKSRYILRLYLRYTQRFVQVRKNIPLTQVKTMNGSNVLRICVPPLHTSDFDESRNDLRERRMIHQINTSRKDRRPYFRHIRRIVRRTCKHDEQDTARLRGRNLLTMEDRLS